MLVAGLVAVVVGGALLADRAPAPESLLGRADVRPSLVATGPPPAGELRLAWEHGTDQDLAFSWLSGAPGGRVVDGVLDVDGRVALDLATGRPLAWFAQAEGPGGAGLVVDGDALLAVDVRSGSVLARRPLPTLDDGLRVVRVLGDTVAGLALLVAPEVRGPGEGAQILLLDDDLEVAGRLPDGQLVADRWLLRPVDDPEGGGPPGPALPQEAFEDFPHELLDVVDGTVVARLPERPRGPLVPLDGMLVGMVGRQLVDVAADDGASPLGVEEGALLLGGLDDRLVVALDRFGPTWAVVLVDPARPDAPQVLGEVDDPTVGGRTMPERVGAASGHVVAVQDGRVVAWDVTGQQVWTRRLAGAGSVRVAEGHVVVQPGEDGRRPSGAGGGTTVLDVRDGSTVWSLARTQRGLEPVVSVDDRVLIGFGGVLGSAGRPVGDWLDVVDGTTTDAPEGVVPRLDGGMFASLVGLVPVDGVPMAVAWAVDEQGDAWLGVGGAPLEVVEGLGDDEQQPAAQPIGAVPDGVLVQRPIPAVLAEGPPPLLLVDLGDRTVAEFDAAEAGRGAWVDDSLLLLPDGNTITAVEPGTTRAAWSTSMDGLVPVGVAGDAVVLAGPTRVRVLDRADGAVRVDRQLEAVAVASELAGDLLLRRMPDGRVVAVDLGDGEVRWSTGSGAAPVSTTAVMGDHLLLGTVGGRVVELAGDGRVVRDLEVGTGPVGSLALVDGTLVVTVDGVVRGFRTDATGVVESDRVDVPDAP